MVIRLFLSKQDGSVQRRIKAFPGRVIGPQVHEIVRGKFARRIAGNLMEDAVKVTHRVKTALKEHF